MPFRDRADAGRQLAPHLACLDLASPVVLGLPRGGIPVAAEVAAALGVGLDVLMARKVGMPGHAELGIGAVAEGLDEVVVSTAGRELGLSAHDLQPLAERARADLERRVARYRGDRPLPVVAGKDVVLVDDGLATGVTAEAGLRALRARHPRRLVLAVPVCARETAERLVALADDMVSVEAPARLFAVGQWYDDFSQTTDQEVVDLLAYARQATARGSGSDDRGA